MNEIGKIISPQMTNFEWGPKGSQTFLLDFIPEAKKESFSKLPISEIYFESKNENMIFKLMAIDRPLPIQVFPNEEQLKLLSKNNPTSFPSNIAKTEIIIAIDQLAMFYGFQSSDVIMKNISKYKTLDHLKDLDLPDIFLKICEDINLAEKIRDEILFSDEKTREEILFLQMHTKFPFDSGSIICSFFLNFVELENAHMIAVLPNEIYCLVSGNAMVVTNKSQNLCRCGMTFKKKNMDLFMNCVDFKFDDPLIYVPEVTEVPVPYGKKEIKCYEIKTSKTKFRLEEFYFHKTPSAPTLIPKTMPFDYAKNPMEDSLIFFALDTEIIKSKTLDNYSIENAVEKILKKTCIEIKDKFHLKIKSTTHFYIVSCEKLYSK